MEVFFSVSGILLLAYVSYKVWFLLSHKLPPGPIGIPVLGYLPFLREYPHKTFSKLATKYGPILSMYLGNRVVIVLNDYNSIKEAFATQGDIFNSRPDNNPFSLMGVGIVSSNENEFNEHKKIILRSLKGGSDSGTSAIEYQITDEIQHFINRLKKDLNKVKTQENFREILTISVVNNTSALILGRRFEYDDKDFIALGEEEEEMTRLYGLLSLDVFLTWFRYLPAKLRHGNVKTRMLEITNKFNKFARKIIRDHDVNPNAYQPGDYIETFKNESKRSHKGQHLFTEEWLLGNIHHLYAGGIETVRAILMWAIVYLIRNEDIQHRVHQELDTVIGRDRAPRYNDRMETPYTDAVLMEVERLASIVPMGLAHSNKVDARLNGYDIPKESYILANIWAVHHDPTLWNEPETFDPNRFLKGGKAERPEYLIPFGIGKRQCVGMAMAKVQLYLYFTSLMQNFAFSTEDGVLPSLETKQQSLVLDPKPFKSSIILRT